MISELKEYINEAKVRKSLIRRKELEPVVQVNEIKLRKETETLNQANISSSFLIDEVFRLIDELHREFSKIKAGDVSNEEILRRREAFPKNLNQLDRLSTKVQHVLQVIPDTFSNKYCIITEIKDEYKSVLHEKKLYEEYFEFQYKERDLMKKKSFQNALLNIQLPKLKGLIQLWIYILSRSNLKGSSSRDT